MIARSVGLALDRTFRRFAESAGGVSERVGHRLPAWLLMPQSSTPMPWSDIYTVFAPASMAKGTSLPQWKSELPHDSIPITGRPVAV